MNQNLQKVKRQLISLVWLLKYRVPQNFNPLPRLNSEQNKMSATNNDLKSFAEADFVTGNKTPTVQLQPLFINPSIRTIMKTKNLFTRGMVMLLCLMIRRKSRLRAPSRSRPG